ncbi:MAG: hypothetical protein JWQ71_4071 [Pedosphaera sp.]|nr:hypothetical protein [Pedosphaera sp.]
MKPTPQFLRKLAAITILFTLVGFAPTAPAKDHTPLTAQVVRLTGEARYSTHSNHWHILKLGNLLPIGSVIQTAGKSSVDLLLAPEPPILVPPQLRSRPGPPLITRTPPSSEQATENVLRIFENSVLVIDQLASQKTKTGLVNRTHLDLRAGVIMGSAKKSSATLDYQVKFPTGTATILQGTYHLAASGVVDALADSVNVNITIPNADGSVTTRDIPAGYRFDPATSRILAIPADRHHPDLYYISKPKLLAPPSAPLLRPGI